jgi:hypothetical protein
MGDYREVTSTSWGSRIGGSLKGIIFGFILFLVAFPLLFWNEGRTVERYKSLVEGSGLVVTVSGSTVNPANEGQLVHLTDTATTDETLEDSQLGISAQAIKLRRIVEMYQWQEQSRSHTEKKAGGGTETTTTYSYNKTWSSSLINSSNFKRPSEHQNPSSMPWQSMTREARKVDIGAFQLSPAQVSAINNYSSLDVSAKGIPPQLGNRAQRYMQGYYLGDNPSMPQIGDIRISHEIVQPTTISLVAQQVNNSFIPYQTEAGGTIDILETGAHTAQALFEQEQTANTMLSWLLRAAGLFVMFIGLSMILKPLSVLADVIPMIGNIVGAGTNLIAFIIAAVMSLLTIAIAWIFYRPLLAGALIIGAVALFWFSRKKVKAAPQKIPVPPQAPVSGKAPPPPPPGG